MAMNFVENTISTAPYKKEIKMDYRLADVVAGTVIDAACGADTDSYTVGTGKKANIRISIIIVEEDV